MPYVILKTTEDGKLDDESGWGPYADRASAEKMAMELLFTDLRNLSDTNEEYVVNFKELEYHPEGYAGDLTKFVIVLIHQGSI